VATTPRHWDGVKEAGEEARQEVRDWLEATARCLADDLDRCLTFYQVPEAHWSHLRTRNPIESIFAPVRLRTNAARRFKRTQSGVRLVYQVIVRLQSRWRRLKSAHYVPGPPCPGPGRDEKRVRRERNGRMTLANFHRN
jgi:transposase-like protein